MAFATIRKQDFIYKNEVGVWFYACPSCGVGELPEEEYDFCPKCGVPVDWSEYEEENG